MGKVRQLTSEEAHVLDHLVDVVMTDQDIEAEKNLLHRAAEMLGNYRIVQQYVFNKIDILDNKVAEEYDDGEGNPFEPVPRAPFGGTWEDVPNDWITQKYLRESGQQQHITEETDRLGAGTADRLEFGMLMRRRKK